jgi:predicted metal-binding protein
MAQASRRRLLVILAGAVVAVVLVVGGYGVYLADMAGYLPWQAEPTRIAITPFADIPGFTAAPAATAPTPTVAP